MSTFFAFQSHELLLNPVLVYNTRTGMYMYIICRLPGRRALVKLCVHQKHAFRDNHICSV